MLPPEVLHALHNLPLAASRAAEGLVAGQHPSHQRGAGLEFSQYRPYQPGDDLRRLDWRLAARSDRYYLREAEVEANLTVHLLLDATASMNHRDDNGLTKLDYGRLLLGALAYLAHRQGDEVALTVLHPAGRQHVPPRSDAQQLARVFHVLEQATATGRFPAPAELTALTGRAQRGLVVCVSDLYEEQAEISQLLMRLRAAGAEVLLLHLLAGNELRFTYQGTLTFEELETGRKVQLDADAQRAGWLSRQQQWLHSTATTARRQGFDYHLLDMAAPLTQALRLFLQRRRARP